MSLRLVWASIIVVGWISSQSALASAQPGSAAAPTAEVKLRRGLMLGFGFGGGELSCEDIDGGGDGPCNAVTEALSLDIHIGWMVTPRLAIMADSWGMVHYEDFFAVTQTIATIAAQYWVIPRLWIKGGLGFANAHFTYDGPLAELAERSQNVPAGIVGAGYEIVTGPTFALDLQLRAGTGIYEQADTKAHNVAVAVGFSWY